MNHILLQMSGPDPAIFNVIAVGILIIYAYYHIESRRATNANVKRQARQRATVAVLGFCFYSVVVAAYGPSGTWVEPIGWGVNSYFERLARGIVSIGPSAEGGISFVGAIQTIGLVVYIVVFSILSVSNGAIKRVWNGLSKRF
jgi:hypothetical protein